jgi:hypothetical protein
VNGRKSRTCSDFIPSLHCELTCGRLTYGQTVSCAPWAVVRATHFITSSKSEWFAIGFPLSLLRSFIISSPKPDSRVLAVCRDGNSSDRVAIVFDFTPIRAVAPSQIPVTAPHPREIGEGDLSSGTTVHLVLDPRFINSVVGTFEILK